MRTLRRILTLFRFRRVEADLAEEIAHHEYLKERELEAAGVPEGEITSARRRAMGNTERAREDAREIWLRPWLQNALQDLTYAARMLRRQPAFALMVVLTLGVAMSFTISIAAAFNSLFLRPWQVRDPEHVVSVGAWPRHIGFSIPEYGYYVSQARSFDGLILTGCPIVRYIACTVELNGGDVAASFVSPNFFQVLGVPMTRGRGFLLDDVGRGSAVAVVS